MSTTLIDYSYAPPEFPPPLTFKDGLFTKGRSRLRVPTDRVLILTPDRNEKQADYTGAFLPEAKAFADLHGIPHDQIHAIRVNKSMHERALQSLQLIEEHEPQVLAVFCHGYSTGIQIGFRSPVKVKRAKGWYTPPAHAEEDFRNLIELMAANKNPVLALYCCSTGDDPDGDPDSAPGSGDDSFADLLRDGLCEAGARTCRVFAHVTAGHTSRNPHAKFYDGNYSATGGVGAAYLARPGSSAFVRLAKALKTDLRLRLPFLSTARLNELLDSV